MDFERYRETIASRFPQIPVRTFRPILEGWSSFVFEVNGTTMFRFPRRPEIEPSLEKESRLLPALARALPVPVPIFQFAGHDDDGRPFVGYKKIPGVPLTADRLLPAQASSLAQQLSCFLSALHRFPVQQAAQLGVPNLDPGQWYQQRYGELYAWVLQQLFPLLEASERDWTTALWEGFLADEANRHFRPALVHCDLAGEHILWDPDTGTLAGIIDWEDAVIGDPAIDFVGLLDGMGWPFVEQVLSSYQGEVDPAFRQRMDFYRKACPYYEIQFGMLTGDQTWFDHGLEELRSH